jgi:transposase-like protein
MNCQVKDAFIAYGRAVDQDGEVLEILVQSRRDKKAAMKFFRKLLKGLRYLPRSVFSQFLESLRHTSASGRHPYRARGCRARN